MPSTITTYYTFVPATKARSSQVNTNFSNYRGDLLPIEENTVSASHLTHNLGGPDHRWDNMYGDALNLRASTTTANSIIQAQTGVTAGATEILHGVNTAVVFDVDGFTLKGSTSTVDPIFKVSTTVTAGAMDLLFGSVTISSWEATGLNQNSLKPSVPTTTSAIGQVSYIGITTPAISGTTTILTLRMSTKGSGAVLFQTYGTRVFTMAVSTTSFNIYLFRGTTTTALASIWSETCTIYNQGAVGIVQAQSFIWNQSYVDTSYTSGEVVYRLYIDNATGLSSFRAGAIAKEL